MCEKWRNFLTKGFTEEEMDTKAIGFFKDLLVLQSKCIDAVRENCDFDKDNNTATFGDDLSRRWELFVWNNLVNDDERNEIDCVYEDKNGKYRLIPDVLTTTEQLQFVMKNYGKLYLDGELTETVELKSSVCIRWVEAILWNMHLDYTLPPEQWRFLFETS